MPEHEPEHEQDGMKVTVTRNGPYRVDGGVPLARWTIVPNDDGESWEWRKDRDLESSESYRLCRCGQSSNKPFCDDTHERIDWDGTETASREPYLRQAGAQEGPYLVLTDAERLCAFARFCDAKGSAWALVERDDPDAAALTEREARRCVSGRLIAWRRDEDGKPHALEDDFEPSIAVVQDPGIEGSAGLWVRGGIPVVSEDDTPYEPRNRQALCRCGGSGNKPFCDGTHASIGFQDPNA